MEKSSVKYTAVSSMYSRCSKTGSTEKIFASGHACLNSQVPFTLKTPLSIILTGLNFPTANYIRNKCADNTPLDY